MSTTPLVVLRTRKYTPDNAHLEEQETIGTVTLELDPTREIELNEDGDPTTYYIARVQTEPNVTVQDIHCALRDMLRVGCSCEHDCCGHLNGGAAELIDHHPVYLLTAKYYQNY